MSNATVTKKARRRCEEPLWEFGHDEGVDNAIAVSFVEHLPYPGEPGTDIADLLGPKLAAELRQQRPPSAFPSDH